MIALLASMPCAVSAEARLQAAATSIELPAPSGIYAVGTTVLHVVDRDRPDSLGADGAVPRELTAQLWYPTDAVPPPRRAPYLIDAGLREALLAEGYYGQTAERIEAWVAIRTSAGEGLPLATSRRPFPVLFVSPGLGVSRVHYTSLAQELASHGNVVVALDHPYGGPTVLPDGRVLGAGGRTDLEDPEGIRAETSRWARDATATLDRLLAGRDSIAGVAVADRLDPGRIGYVGHSLGGAAAWQACRDDPRFRACAGLDGTPVGEFMEAGFAAPTLIVQSEPDYSDADLEAAGRTRREWDSAGAAAGERWRFALGATEHPVYRIRVRGFGHLSYGDAPFVMPGVITRFGGRIVGPRRGFELVSAYLRAFFDRTLSDRPAPLLDGPSPLWPEVVFDRP